MAKVNTEKKYLLNTFWSLLEKAARIISGILVGVLVARYLGAEQFGKISYAITITAVFSVFATLGLESIIIRELVKNREAENEILGTAFRIKLIGAVVSFIILMFIGFIIEKEIENVIILCFTASALLLQSFTVIDSYFQSQAQGRYVAINQVVTLTLSAIIKLLLIYYRASLIAFASIVLVESFFVLINQFVFYKKIGRSILLWRYDKEKMRQLLKYAAPIILSGFITVIYQKIDQLFIRGMINFEELGNYSAAQRISEAWSFIPMAASVALFPGILNMADNRLLQIKRTKQICALMLWSALFIVIGTQIFGDWVINLFYKDAFPLAAQILKVHIWTNLAVYFGVVWALFLYAENKQRLLVVQNVFSLIVSLLLNLYLIPRMGALGSAYAAIASYSAGILFTIFVFDKKNSLPIFVGALNPVHLVQAIQYFSIGLKKTNKTTQ